MFSGEAVTVRNQELDEEMSTLTNWLEFI